MDAIEKRWIYGWMKKGFAKKKNPDLWMRLMRAFAKHNVKLIWVKGHAGHPENERCDQLSIAAAKGKNLSPDEYFESQPKKIFE